MNLRDDVDSRRSDRPGAPALITYPSAVAWRRRLGPLAWVALEYLALSSHLTDDGWVAPIGVRDVAEGIGVTKDTAARAVAALAAAGLATLARVEWAPGLRRSGYRLHLPEPMRLVGRSIRSPDGPTTACDLTEWRRLARMARYDQERQEPNDDQA